MITVFKAIDSSSESCMDGLVCVKTEDDTPGCFSTTELGTNLPGDDTYYILIHGYGGDTGNFELTVSREDELITLEPTMFPSVIPTFSPTHNPVSSTQSPTSSPETPSTFSVAPLNPNPDSFETDSFPENPWFIDGDGEWSRSSDNAFDGSFSIKSPDFAGSNVPMIANATLLLGSDFRGGRFEFHYYASVSAPQDVLRVYLDGETIRTFFYDESDPNVWDQSAYGLPPGEHEIVFSYQYNVFGLGENLVNVPRPGGGEIQFEGAAIDNVQIIEVDSEEMGRHI